MKTKAISIKKIKKLSEKYLNDQLQFHNDSVIYDQKQAVILEFLDYIIRHRND